MTQKYTESEVQAVVIDALVAHHNKEATNIISAKDVKPEDLLMSGDGIAWIL